MKLINSGEYTVNVFGVILPSGDGLDGAECETMLRAHPELANSIGRNGLTVDAEAAKILGIKASPVPQPEESDSIGRNGLTVDAEAAKILGIKASPVPQPEESAPPAPAKK